MPRHRGRRTRDGSRRESDGRDIGRVWRARYQAPAGLPPIMGGRGKTRQDLHPLIIERSTDAGPSVRAKSPVPASHRKASIPYRRILSPSGSPIRAEDSSDGHDRNGYD